MKLCRLPIMLGYHAGIILSKVNTSYCFIARDGEERQKWMECLEESIKHATYSRVRKN